MKSEIKNKKRKRSCTGEYMVLGVPAGLILGLLFLDGNITMGMGLGLCLGLIIGAIADARAAQQEKDNNLPT